MRDLRLAFRSLARQPGFTAIAVLTIALGVGANSAIFTVVDAVMLRPLPFTDPDTVVVLTERNPALKTATMSAENYTDACSLTSAFVACGAQRSTFFNVSGIEEPLRVSARMISANMLAVLAVAPEIGRGLLPSDDRVGAEPVAIVSAGLWRTQLGGVNSLENRRIVLDGTTHRIVGVMPSGFRILGPADVYVPLSPFLATQPLDRGWHPGILPIARLKPGVSLEQARSDIRALAERLQAQHPDTNRGVGMEVTRARDLLVSGVRTPLIVLLGAVGVVLLIACINVAGLLLARGLSRRRDIAVRIALGASRFRIATLLLAESLLIGVLGGVVGLAISAFSVPILVHMVGPSLPRADAIGVDLRVVWFTMGLAVTTGILFGMVPALHSTRVEIRQALNDDGRAGMGGSLRQRKARNILVVVEVALTVMLTVSAALLIRSLSYLQRVPSGFDTTHLLAADLPLSSITYDAEGARVEAVRQVVKRAAALPGVRGAAATTQLPMEGGGSVLHFNIEGKPPASPADYTFAYYRSVTIGYFATMGIPVRAGRAFQERDSEGTGGTVVVNETMARQFFGFADPVGSRIQLGTVPSPDGAWLEVVGIVADVRQSVDVDPRPEMYVPYTRPPDAFLSQFSGNVTLVVRTAGANEETAGELSAIVRRLDANQPLVNVRTMDEVRSASVDQPRFRTLLLGLFAAIALVLAGIGLYGLLAHGVAQRLNEFGLRMALGASPEAVARLVLVQGLRLTSIGIAAGGVAAAIVADLMRGFLYGVSPWDPVAWLAANVTLLGVSILASWLPARRALQTEPVVALRV